MKHIKVVDYGAGNLHSVLNSVRKVAQPDETVTLCADANEISQADRVILPGVGAYRACKDGLNALPGMIDALNDFALTQARPILGICVGMQLLVETGDEHGTHTDGLGWINGHVRRIMPQSTDAKIPHMGWNDLEIAQSHPIFSGIISGADVYFVHSYAAQDVPAEQVIATTDYFGSINAAISKNNIVGTQFHPEKSQKNGLQILRNFLDWQPA